MSNLGEKYAEVLENIKTNGLINFSDKKYLEALKNIETIGSNGDNCELTAAQAFFYLISGLKISDLDNLCEQISTKFLTIYPGEKLSMEEAYKLLQGEDIREVQLTQDQRMKLQQAVLDEAYEVIKPRKDEQGNEITLSLGNGTTPDGKFNTSSWISHSLYVAKFAETIAAELSKNNGIDLNVDSVKSLALLHDCGRKDNHTMGHVIIGAEKLIDAGYPNASVAAIMHSFFAGKRCGNNEPAIEGFVLDEKGKESWEVGSPKDDIREYLESHKLTITDLIINLGDLVATDRGVVPLFDRLEDIKSRRPNLDNEPNREFFLLETVNGMNYILEKLGVEVPKEIKYSLSKVGDGVPKAEESVKSFSQILHDYYIETTKEEKKNSTPKPKKEENDDNDDKEIG